MHTVTDATDTPGTPDTPTLASARLAGRDRPGWGWSITSAAFIVGFAAIFFRVPPFWYLLWLGVLIVVIRLTPLGERTVQREQSALLAGLVPSQRITSRPLLTAVAAFLPLLVILPAFSWDLSDPADLWNGGILCPIAVFGLLTWTVVQELRATGHRARWWTAWVVLAVLVAGFFLVGGPARLRWNYCKDRLTTVVAAGGEVTSDNTGALCWHDAEQRVVDGDIRLYTDAGDTDGNDAAGLVYSPDGAVERSGDIRSLIDLGGGWYWFETGSLVRDFWFDS